MFNRNIGSGLKTATDVLMFTHKEAFSVFDALLKFSLFLSYFGGILNQKKLTRGKTAKANFEEI